MAAASGWVTTATDLLRFARAVDGSGIHPDIIEASSLAMMTARTFSGGDPLRYYGLGWNVDYGGYRWHWGSLPGTLALLLIAPDGLAWAAVFNAAPPGFDGALKDALRQARDSVTDWPAEDLFDRVP